MMEQVVSFAIPIVALLFALVMMKVTGNQKANDLGVFVAQGVTAAIALIVLASGFYEPLFRFVSDSRIFFLILAMMALVYVSRDIMDSYWKHHEGEPSSNKKSKP